VDSQQADLVLLDLRLGTDAEAGWRVLDHLTLDPSTRRLPVILWSGSHDALCGRAAALLTKHGVYLLNKPFDIGMLLGIVAEALAASPPAALRASGPVAQLETRSQAQSLADAGQQQSLTQREQQVAALVARGYTNQQIASQLVISNGTASNHVAHILKKLDCSSRTQIAVWVISNGLDQPRIEDRVRPGLLVLEGRCVIQEAFRCG
jgi:DNA-binding NarL/FixJ family response regulator